MSFQTTVLFVATVILLVVLVVIGFALYKTKTSGVLPILGDCPDYWIAKNDGTNNLCLNVKNLGRNECPKSMNFNQSPWLGDSGLCNKSKWAKACDLTWDGITNDNTLCSNK